MKVYLPYRAEFGHVVMHHAPLVHADKDDKVVCVEPGMEALYPSATSYHYVDRKEDRGRRERREYDQGFLDRLAREVGMQYGKANLVWPPALHPEDNKGFEYFIPKPHVEVRVEPSPDIVICPRKRDFGPEKNWPHWRVLAESLECCGITTCAAGTADTSDRSVEDVVDACTWLYDRPLDATIAAMLAADLVIATDAGLAHLALLCGRPLMMVVSGMQRRTAPGYHPVKWHRYAQVNHRHNFFMAVANTWEHPALISAAAQMWLAQREGDPLWSPP